MEETRSNPPCLASILFVTTSHHAAPLCLLDVQSRLLAYESLLQSQHTSAALIPLPSTQLQDPITQDPITDPITQTTITDLPIITGMVIPTTIITGPDTLNQLGHVQQAPLNLNLHCYQIHLATLNSHQSQLLILSPLHKTVALLPHLNLKLVRFAISVATMRWSAGTATMTAINHPTRHKLMLHNLPPPLLPPIGTLTPA